MGVASNRAGFADSVRAGRRTASNRVVSELWTPRRSGFRLFGQLSDAASGPRGDDAA